MTPVATDLAFLNAVGASSTWFQRRKPAAWILALEPEKEELPVKDKLQRCPESFGVIRVVIFKVAF